MNGLEAIKAMEQGRIVIDDRGSIVRMKDGMIEVSDDWGQSWQEATCLPLDIEFHEYAIKSLTGWERVKEGSLYRVSHADGIELKAERGVFSECDYKNANYFSTKEKAEEINFKQTLFRKLQRFSDENGGNEIDWSDRKSLKYFIRYDDVLGRFIVDTYFNYQNFGQIYFISKDVADRAVELFHDELIKYFTHDWRVVE